MFTAADIAEELGGACESADGNWRCLCPVHGSTRPSLSLRDGPYGLLIHCFAGCDRDDIRAELDAMGLLDSTGFTITEHRRGSENREAKRLERAREIWNARLPATGTVVETYLHEARAIPLKVTPPSLGFLPVGHFHTWRSEAGRSYPSMVAAVVGAANALVAVHQTWILPDGSDKAPLGNLRLTFGFAAGGAVRLADWCGGPLVIGEGIETALSAGVLLGMPAWSTLSEGGIRSLVLPQSVRDIRIFVDHDADGIGEGAAREAAMRWLAEDRKIDLVIPDRVGADANDLLREQHRA